MVIKYFISFLRSRRDSQPQRLLIVVLNIGHRRQKCSTGAVHCPVLSMIHSQCELDENMPVKLTNIWGKGRKKIVLMSKNPTCVYLVITR